MDSRWIFGEMKAKKRAKRFIFCFPFKVNLRGSQISFQFFLYFPFQVHVGRLESRPNKGAEHQTGKLRSIFCLLTKANQTQISGRKNETILILSFSEVSSKSKQKFRDVKILILIYQNWEEGLFWTYPPVMQRRMHLLVKQSGLQKH